jgi:hypothetical protein
MGALLEIDGGPSDERAFRIEYGLTPDARNSVAALAIVSTGVAESIANGNRNIYDHTILLISQYPQCD